MNLRHLQTLLLILFVFSAQVIIAQDEREKITVIPKGTLYLGGSIAFDTYNIETDPANSSESKVFSASLSPSVGKYIKDNFALGIGVSAGISKNKYYFQDELQSESKGNSFGLNAFIRKNYSLVPNLFAFLDGSVGIGYINFQNENFDVENKGHEISGLLSCRAGLQYFITPKLSLETNLGSLTFRHSKVSYDDSDQSTTLNYLRLQGWTESVFLSVKYFISSK